jgi:hypothetical protein
MFGSLKEPDNNQPDLGQYLNDLKTAVEKAPDWCQLLVTKREVAQALNVSNSDLNITGVASEEVSTINCNLTIAEEYARIDTKIEICDDGPEACEKIIGEDPVKISFRGNLTIEQDKNLRELISQKLEPILEN